MNSLASVFAVLDPMRREGLFADYAIGGATAVLQDLPLITRRRELKPWPPGM